jgi:hypothetical protein
MSHDPKNPQLPDDGQARPRRKYTAPRLKQLGSVRDLTLGSPPGKAADGAGARRNAM